MKLIMQGWTRITHLGCDYGKVDNEDYNMVMKGIMKRLGMIMGLVQDGFSYGKADYEVGLELLMEC